VHCIESENSKQKNERKIVEFDDRTENHKLKNTETLTPKEIGIIT